MQGAATPITALHSSALSTAGSDFSTLRFAHMGNRLFEAQACDLVVHAKTLQARAARGGLVYLY